MRLVVFLIFSPQEHLNYVTEISQDELYILDPELVAKETVGTSPSLPDQFSFPCSPSSPTSPRWVSFWFICWNLRTCPGTCHFSLTFIKIKAEKTDLYFKLINITPLKGIYHPKFKVLHVSVLPFGSLLLLNTQMCFGNKLMFFWCLENESSPFKWHSSGSVTLPCNPSTVMPVT